MKKMQLAIVGMVPLPMAAAAKTVAYWPLAYDNAQRTTLDTVFPNQGDGGTIDLKPVSISEHNGATMIEDTTGAYCPVGTNAFPSGWCVWDPVARTNATAATGISFKIPPDYTPSSPDNYSRCGKQGWLRATNVSVDYSAFTVEFFYRPDPLTSWAAQSPWQALTRMLRHDNGNTYINWSLVRVNANNLNLYYSNTSGTSQNTGNIALTGYSNLTDNTNKKFMPVLWYPEDMSYTNSSFTVECIYKSPKNIGNQWRPLVYQMGNGNNNSMSNIVFKIGYGYSYRISGIICGYSASANMFAANETKGTTATQNDGEWHHAALVVDRTKKRMFLFCDYKDATTNTKTLPGTLCDPAAADYPVAIGSWYPSRAWPSNDNPSDVSPNSGTSTSAFWGCVDAVRITKRALKPSEFIRSPDKRGLIIVIK